jgi:signal peptidase I
VSANPTSVDPAAADQGQPPADQPSTRRRFLRGARELVLILVIALVASALLRAFVVQAFYVPTGSMLPEIQLHDKILVSHIGGIHRGEVVVFKDPGGWIPPDEKSGSAGPIHSALEFIGLLPDSSDDHLVKRVIGLPGDHVVCCNKEGRLRINGDAIDESSYLFQGDARADDLPFNVIVPAGHIFVLGDHRYESGDSSRHLPSQGAFVPESLVTGRAMAVIWPLGDAHVMRIPAAFKGIPPSRTPPQVGIIRTGDPGQSKH